MLRITVGHPDCVCCKLAVGRFIALEVKKPGEKPTKDQERFLSVVRSMGGFAAVVRSVEEAEAAIERAKRGATE